ncbi:OmpH family outer membrane protein [Robbsia andropogonis]|uniref:OmpH family outer membrane protein n=1 Tax=Robbsia andropogonis TaxID=28092 RepID=UPI0021B36548|nr:OmpH family outer membrane protein [Robbsia andropogonis]
MTSTNTCSGAAGMPVTPPAQTMRRAPWFIAATRILSGLVAGSALLAWCAPAARADEHIAVVKSDQILKESVPAKALSSQIDEMFRKRGADLQSRVNKFQSDASNFDKTSASLSADERAARQARLQTVNMALQRDRQYFADDLTQCQNQAYQAVLAIANKAIEQVAKQGNYDLIVEEGVYFNPRIDITDKVLAALASQPVPPLPDICKRSSK